MSNASFFSRLSRAAFGGRRRTKLHLLRAVEEDEYKTRLKVLSLWANDAAADLFIKELEKRRDEHKEKRLLNYKDHLAVITAMTAEAAFEEAIGLLNALKASGHASEQDNES